jgi:DNA polymerase-1
MEMTGIKVDREYIIKLKTEMDSYIASSESLFADMIPVGLENFNPASTQHVAKVLFSTGYINPEDQQVICYAGKIEPEKTDKGAISTGAKFLKLLALTHKCKFSEAVLEFRAISKARTTFVENIEVLSREDGRLHSNFHQHSTATARLSSTEENMQNLPTKMGRPPFQYNIKRIFIPSYEDYVFVNTDAKAAEVRIYAAYSKDKALIAALNDGMDPHSFFASTVYNAANVLQGIPKHLHRNVLTTIGIDEHHAWNYEDFEARDTLKKTDKVYGSQLDALRKNIKRVVFGILYGAAPKKISGIVGIPEEQADAIIRTLFNMFPSIKDYINITKEQVRRMGIVETFLGRRRHLNLGNLPDYLKSRAERQAVNFKIQNTSAELVLEVLCATFPVIHHDFNGNVLNTVHDSLVFEIPKKYVHQMPDFINDYGMKQIAKKYPWLPVPFTWDVSVGPTYGDLMSVESYLSNNPEIQSDEDDYIDLEIRNELYDEATLGMHRQAS